jgi:pseudouridine-5'-phosphate glycosidase
MEQLFQAAADYFVITVIGGCFVLGMVLKSLTTIVTTSSRERSRREIAAYIAEGSMSAEQGERLVRADVNRGANRAA